MPQVIQTTVFKYDELEDAAKEKARNWFREASAGDEIHEFIFSDLVAIGALMGLEIAEKDIHYTGFWSQGDGASFTGSYKFVPNAFDAVKDYAPKDSILHNIAAEFDAIQKKYNNRIAATISRMSSHYSHSNTMTADAWLVDENGDDTGEADTALPEADFRELLENFRALANWCYRTLEKEYEYQNSEETVSDNIRANEYTFTAAGKRFG